jgi:hypothetical protein
LVQPRYPRLQRRQYRRRHLPSLHHFTLPRATSSISLVFFVTVNLSAFLFHHALLLRLLFHFYFLLPRAYLVTMQIDCPHPIVSQSQSAPSLKKNPNQLLFPTDIFPQNIFILTWPGTGQSKTSQVPWGTLGHCFPCGPKKQSCRRCK